MARGAPDPTQGTEATGYFGKIPTQGDFVQRNLSRGVVDRLDDWTRQCVRESQRHLGRGWLDAFLVAPVWRGLVARDRLGPDPLALVMMPSVDRIGRYFPLVLAVPLPDHRGPLTALPRQMAGWFDRAEALALSTLAPEFRRATLDSALETLSPQRWFQPALRTMPQDGARSLWWVGEDTAAMQGFDGLPAPETFHRVFLGGPPGSPPSSATSSAGSTAASKPTTQPQAGSSAGPAAVVHPEGAAPVRPPETRVLIDIDSAGAALKGTRSAMLTDAFAIGEDSQAMSVISGLGAHPGLTGAVETVREALAAIAGPFSMSDLISEAKGKLGRANAMLCARGQPSDTVFAASAATLLVQGNRHAVLWSGNVRCYLLRDGQMSRLTRDHVDPVLASVVTRAVGASRQLSLESALGEARPGDRFLLCSGGLAAALPEPDIARTLATAATSRQAATHLTQDALIAGASLDVAALAVILRSRTTEDGGLPHTPDNQAGQADEYS
ncbi:type VI secretion system-associated protein TagF [Mesobaculum littorinae]|uniref:Type VI secretion system-associated protein TagF n=1 Tax=Mesobaculum littorinae TaxID=2486419 RepID=A0A438AI77_9RHOB|nr:type VI secretion system-associated protein TagF [Mesobaculum littorinae]RVV98297.1 type VI secretion system-associated protein TagF [Mesobaculum littorinae]